MNYDPVSEEGNNVRLWDHLESRNSMMALTSRALSNESSLKATGRLVVTLATNGGCLGQKFQTIYGSTEV